MKICFQIEVDVGVRKEWCFYRAYEVRVRIMAGRSVLLMVRMIEKQKSDTLLKQNVVESS